MSDGEKKETGNDTDYDKLSYLAVKELHGELIPALHECTNRIVKPHGILYISLGISILTLVFAIMSVVIAYRSLSKSMNQVEHIYNIYEINEWPKADTYYIKKKLLDNASMPYEDNKDNIEKKQSQKPQPLPKESVIRFSDSVQVKQDRGYIFISMPEPSMRDLSVEILKKDGIVKDIPKETIPALNKLLTGTSVVYLKDSGQLRIPEFPGYILRNNTLRQDGARR